MIGIAAMPGIILLLMPLKQVKIFASIAPQVTLRWLKELFR